MIRLKIVYSLNISGLNMQTQTIIEEKITHKLQPIELRVENESHMHSVPPNSETHFKVTVVSESFSDLSPVKRHQLMYGLLSEELAGPVHALALHTFTPSEWQTKQASVPSSPNCLGGSKAK